jgi:hypothetical protein
LELPPSFPNIIRDLNVFVEPEHVTKVITWKRTTSSRSASSRNALATPSKDDADDSGSDFIEEFCMIAGSHSSTLDRLYAWERKMYDEVKVLLPKLLFERISWPHNLIEPLDYYNLLLHAFKCTAI